MSDWGQINSGQRYGVLCVDIDRALAHMKLTPIEQMIVQYVREYSWGTAAANKGGRNKPWPEAKPCPVNLSRLAIEWGVSRERLTIAKGHLIERGVFVENLDGIEINKDVESWHGLSRKGLDYARAGINTGVTRTSQCMQSDGACTVTRTSHGCYEDVTPPVTRTSHPDSSPLTPYKEARARQKISEEKEKSSNQGGGPAILKPEYPPDVEGDRIAAEAREVAREWGWPDEVVEWAADMAPLKDDWPMFRAALIHGAVARDRIVKDGKQVASPERLIESKYRQFEDQGRAPADPIRPDSRRAAEEAESLHRRMYPLYRAPRDPEREAKQRAFEEKLRVRRAGGGGA